MRFLLKDYPHTCPRCRSFAYVGANDVQCTNEKCEHYALKEEKRYTGKDAVLFIGDTEIGRFKTITVKGVVYDVYRSPAVIKLPLMIKVV